MRIGKKPTVVFACCPNASHVSTDARRDTPHGFVARVPCGSGFHDTGFNPRGVAQVVDFQNRSQIDESLSKQRGEAAKAAWAKGTQQFDPKAFVSPMHTVRLRFSRRLDTACSPVVWHFG